MWKYLSFSRTTVLRDIDCVSIMVTSGVKHVSPPPTFEGIEFPPKARLAFLQKVPQYPPGTRPPKMMKNLKFMRGPEMVHNTLLHKQYGIVAVTAGRMRWGHFEMVRLGIIRKIDNDRMYAMWRIDPPWQPVTKKGQGQRMGGGKGAIDHYVTPIKAGRVIMEIGGNCLFEEVKPILKIIAHNLPFKAEVVNQEILDELNTAKRALKENNNNPYTFEYIIKNNLGNCRRWISKMDKIFYGEYL